MKKMEDGGDEDVGGFDLVLTRNILPIEVSTDLFPDVVLLTEFFWIFQQWEMFDKIIQFQKLATFV